MLEINNNFLLVGLIIVAVTCIYLVYLNLSKSSEITSLKTTVNNLIQQNKKRDEITTFLLDRVETLTAAVNNTAIQQPAAAATTTLQQINPDVILESINRSGVPVDQQHVDSTDFDSQEIDEILAGESLGQANDELHETTTMEVVPDVESNEVESVSIPDVEAVSSSVEETTKTIELNTNTIHNNNIGESVEIVAAVEQIQTQPVELADLPAAINAETNLTAASLDELIKDSEFDTVNFSFISKKHVAEELDTVSEVELDTSIDYTNIPKDKKTITQQYTAKQLKSIARHFGVKSRGTKTELVNRIYEAMSKQTVAVDDETR
jgi:hypothetical protein